LPQGDTSNLATVAAAPASTRIFTGPQNYTDPSGNLWVPDTSASNVTITGGTLSKPVTSSIGATSTPTLYQAERYGNSFSYTFTKLSAGFYSLTLKFAEIYYTNNQTNKGVRVFDVSVNGQQVLTNFDIVAAAGAALTAYDVTFSNIASNNGQIIVQFAGTTEGSDPNAKISAAELDPTWSGAPLLGSGNESDSALFFDQLAQLAWQGYLPGPSPALFRVQDNEMEALRAPGFLLLGDDNVDNGNASSIIMTGNRIEGEISLDQNLAAFDTAQLAATSRAQASAAQTGLNLQLPTGSIVERAPSTFYYMVAVVSISRAAVSSNIIVSVNASGGSGAALLVSAVDTSQPSLAVAGNVLVGSSLVQP
jgi:Malectin domain